MGLNATRNVPTLSAGLKRRGALWRRVWRARRTWFCFDEPTTTVGHFGSIAWLEDFLLRYGGTLLFVTHDRMFLRKLATRIIELDRGQLSKLEL